MAASNRQEETVAAEPDKTHESSTDTGADPRQLAAIKAIVAGENVFLTGGAGCGKSFVIDEAKRRLKKLRRNVVVCAPTGIAAVNVGGTTVHRAFHLGIGVLGRDSRLRVREPVSQADVVIIDEVSMLRCDVFDAVTAILRKVRPKPQLVVVGDFSQLPPVVTGNDLDALRDEYGALWRGPFAFQGRTWDSWDFHPFVLTQCHRQQDSAFLSALTNLRKGDAATCRWVWEHARHEAIPDAPFVAATNRVVDSVNQERLAALTGEEHVFRAERSGKFGCGNPVDETVVLKRGARVVCCKNDPADRFVNGSCGEVVGFSGPKAVRVRLDSGSTVAIEPVTWSAVDYEYDEDDGELHEVELGTFTQMPLRLAWAMTIHKTQGLTLDAMNLNPVCFENGQLYVALSRVRSVEDLALTQPIDPLWLKVDPQVRAFHRQVWETSQAWDPAAHEVKTEWRPKGQKPIAARVRPKPKPRRHGSPA